MASSRISSTSAFVTPLPSFLKTGHNPFHSTTYAISARSSSTVSFRNYSYIQYNTDGTITESVPKLSAGNGGNNGDSIITNRWHRDDDDHGDNSKFLSTPLAMWQRYNEALTMTPLRTKAITAAILGAFSDLLAQRIAPSSSFDLSRVLRAMAAGFLLTGPGTHFWFRRLDIMITGTNPASLVLKVLIDQIVFAPLATCTFLAFMRVTEGRSRKETEHFIKSNIGNTMIDSYKLWPIANLVNFSFVPPAHRVAFASIVSVFWTSYLSVIANS